MACTARRWEGRICAPNCRSYCAQCRRRTSASESTSRRLELDFARLVEAVQCGLGARLADRRQMRVNGRGVQRLVAQINAELAQGYAFLQQMGGIAVAQRVGRRTGMDAAGLLSQSEDFLHR